MESVPCRLRIAYTIVRDIDLNGFSSLLRISWRGHAIKTVALAGGRVNGVGCKVRNMRGRRGGSSISG